MSVPEKSKQHSAMAHLRKKHPKTACKRCGEMKASYQLSVNPLYHGVCFACKETMPKPKAAKDSQDFSGNKPVPCKLMNAILRSKRWEYGSDMQAV